jgi:hypothetical protein
MINESLLESRVPFLLRLRKQKEKKHGGIWVENECRYETCGPALLVAHHRAAGGVRRITGFNAGAGNDGVLVGLEAGCGTEGQSAFTNTGFGHKRKRACGKQNL